jgi:hypothetical protein
MTVLVPARAVPAGRAGVAGRPFASGPAGLSGLASSASVADPRTTGELDSQLNSGLVSHPPPEMTVTKSQKAMAPTPWLLLTLFHRVGSLSLRASAAK